MIKYESGELLDTLSYPLKEQEDVIALSYALKQGVAKMLQYAIRTRLYADIDSIPEEILDYLALELNAPYYDEKMGAWEKREVLKNTLQWYMHSGTKETVQKVVTTIFGSGEVIEWPDFENSGKYVGYFDVRLSGKQSPDMFQKLSEIIELVKNESSHIRKIENQSFAESMLFADIGIATDERCSVGMPYPER